MEPIVQMANISKTFRTGVKANEDVTLTVWPGAIHAIIGENGAGKSTLMGILFGRIKPDRGRIRIRGRDVTLNNPGEAIRLGLGMVTQHTTMIPALSALDNVILGSEPVSRGLIDRTSALKRVQELCARLSVSLDWDAPAGSLSVAVLQKAEIVKALYRGASILILDEPTALLAPEEAEALFRLMHALAGEGTTILFVTHKLNEVMEHSTHVTVLRAGHNVGDRLTAGTTPEELLALMMGGRSGIDLSRREEARAPMRVPLSPPVPVLEVQGVTARTDRGATALHDVTLSVAPGEVLGVAGVDGSGQRELAQVIVGLRRSITGAVLLDGTDVTREPPSRRMKRGLAFIPEDRSREGIIADFSVAENLLLGRQREPRMGGGTILDLDVIAGRAAELIRRHRIRGASPDTPLRVLSGGNQQKVVLARELEAQPRVLVCMQPTRGLDVEATHLVYELIRGAKARGMATILFSLDLDEVLELSDRVAVLYDGRIAGVLPIWEAHRDMVGRLMTAGHS
ncbi:MAG: ABC transporter ATP-binding protein [Chthonomonadales bacterium]